MPCYLQATGWQLEERELLVQRAGGHALPLNLPGPHHARPSVATVVVQLPTMTSAGGSITASAAEHRFDSPAFETPCVAAFADVPMNLQPLTEGERILAVYSLTCPPQVGSHAILPAVSPVLHATSTH